MTQRRQRWVVRIAALALSVTCTWAASGSASAQDRAQDGALALPSSVSQPLEGEVRRVAQDVPDENTPDPGEHYPVSNEWRHDLWFPHVRDLGGAFVGVGSDQGYTLAAVQDAQIAWMVDFDPLVRIVHRMYGVLVPESADADALVARFSAANAAATRALLDERLAGDPDHDRVLRTFDRNRSRWERYLGRLRRLSRDGQGTSWLSDATLYARVRALFVGGRIIARNGDVTGERAVRAIGAAARRLGVPVRVLYFSNAEQFFPYSASFVQNIQGLPSDDRSVVLRTFRGPRATYPDGDRWHYVVHRWPDFTDRLAHGYTHSRQIVGDLVNGRPLPIGADGLTVIDANTPRRVGTAAR